MSARTEYNTEEFVGTKNKSYRFILDKKNRFHFGPAAVKEEKNSYRLVQKKQKKIKTLLFCFLFVCQRIFSPGSNNNKSTSLEVLNFSDWTERKSMYKKSNSKTFLSTGVNGKINQKKK